MPLRPPATPPDLVRAIHPASGMPSTARAEQIASIPALNRIGAFTQSERTVPCDADPLGGPSDRGSEGPDR